MSEQNADESARREYTLLDMHQAYVGEIPIEEARRLLKEKLAVTYGTKKKVHGLRLVVSLSKATGMPEGPQRSGSLSQYTGSRYVFRQMVNLRCGKSKVYRFKKMHETESPEHALRRILTPAALEASTYTRRDRATDEERRHDPGRIRQRRNMEIFHFERQTIRRRRAPVLRANENARAAAVNETHTQPRVSRLA